jgi:hypothetical protein
MNESRNPNSIVWQMMPKLLCLKDTKNTYFFVFGFFLLFCRLVWSGFGELCRNSTLKECEDDIHNPEMGTWEFSRTPENSELDCRGQNTSRRGVLYIVEKLLKRRCQKWLRMSHSDICSTSYVQKKGQESKWQFDSRPLKVENQPDPGVCRWSATHHWKDLKESYKFALDLIPIEGLSKEL